MVLRLKSCIFDSFILYSIYQVFANTGETIGVSSMRLYIIRHGETEWNVLRRFQGRSDIPLNDEGRRLARITAEALSEVPFARIYTSPLKRAYETAMIIKGERDIPI